MLNKLVKAKGKMTESIITNNNNNNNNNYNIRRFNWHMHIVQKVPMMNYRWYGNYLRSSIKHHIYNYYIIGHSIHKKQYY